MATAKTAQAPVAETQDAPEQQVYTAPTAAQALGMGRYLGFSAKAVTQATAKGSPLTAARYLGTSVKDYTKAMGKAVPPYVFT
jgi:hypothetical protein